MFPHIRSRPCLSRLRAVALAGVLCIGELAQAYSLAELLEMPLERLLSLRVVVAQADLGRSRILPGTGRDHAR